MAQNNPSRRQGLVHVYTGDGKGKTTAAFGLALRAAGRGLKVFIAQFAKQRESGEVIAVERLGDLITIRRFGREDFILGKPSPEDRAEAQRGLEVVREVLAKGGHDLVILDEANIAVHYGLMDADDLLRALAERAAHVEAVLTGRNADPRILAAADLVTEMRAVKHYFSKGVRAREGIER